jgi:aspartyl/glutamyl-tRNA(Asn/Gln) amidotransferase C subunit
MTQKIDIRALAALSRLDVSDEEVAKFEKEFPSILAFVETVQKVAADAPKGVAELRNVMREDGEPHESGLYTEALLSAAPLREDNRVIVKQVLSKKK